MDQSIKKTMFSWSPDTNISLADVVRVFVDVSGQAEVTDLHHFIVRKQNVPGCQVSVNTLVEKHREHSDIYETHSHTHTHTYTHTHTHIKYQTLREARNSIPRATWKLKEMRSSRNKGELEADLGSIEKERKAPCGFYQAVWLIPTNIH